MNLTVKQSKLSGEAAMPASKSHTIRGVIIGGLSDGECRLVEPLRSADTAAAVEVMRAFGAEITDDGADMIVSGVSGDLRTPAGPVDVGNSGTTLYIACVTAALADGTVTLTGDEQIQARPVQPLVEAINSLGGHARTIRGNGCAPVEISGPMTGGRVEIECPTSQYLTALLINCPLAAGDTHIEVPLLHERPYVQMTLDWLNRASIEYDNDGLTQFDIPGGQHYPAFERKIPADFSSATFFMAAAAVTGSEITLTGLDMHDPQGDRAVVDMLRKMGVEIDIDGLRMVVRGGDLQGAELDLNATPDALPAMAAVACNADGETLLGNVPQARLKETDRIAVMARELSKMGADVRELEDGLVVHGSRLHGVSVDGHGDHRVVMALAVAGLGCEGVTEISTAEAVNITVPNFVELMSRLGASIHSA
ncbi:MAG: 3-phosphoshikimate 1-carboxyvinyltransferase [Armatimonadota bacterium]